MKTKRNITRRRRLCKFTDAAGDTPELLRRIWEGRNVQHPREVEYALKHLQPPHKLKGIEGAVEALCAAVQREEKILIVGDYDTDGATATALGVLGLRALADAVGATARVEYLAPNRFEYGYGLSPEIAEAALQRAPRLVITVDNGIASVAGVARLRAADVDVIITDHHLPGAELPNANAIVNPNQPGCTFPSKALAGVGVMFYVLLAVRAALRDAGRFASAPPNLAELLDLAALGTVADVVPLDYNNRILVAQGVARVRAGRCRPGIKALLQVAHLRHENCVASDFGFAVGPRLNAAGRMDDISIGIECLLADNAEQAAEYAMRLHEINRERRAREGKMHAQAMHEVAKVTRRRGRDRKLGWCLYDANWHQGIVGLVAGRVREESNQPAIAFAPADDGAVHGRGLRGSARSVDGLHIRDLLEAIATSRPGLIKKFGGHAMAAGLSIAEDDFAEFKTRFGELVAAHYQRHRADWSIRTDGELSCAELSAATAEMLRAASPWGQHFPPPVFDGVFRVVHQQIVGGQHLKLRLSAADGGRFGDGAAALDAIVFRHVLPGQTAPEFRRIRAVYQLQMREFQGVRSLLLVVEYLQEVGG